VKKRGHKRERREKRSSPPKTEEQLAAIAAEKELALQQQQLQQQQQAANEEPVKYVDAPPPKTNPWIKGPPGPLPPAPAQQDPQVTTNIYIDSVCSRFELSIVELVYNLSY
jgi:hypothetical protein